MKTLLHIKKFAIVASIVGAAFALTPSASSAGCYSDPSYRTAAPTYRNVVTWRVQRQPVEVYRTCYDHCGRPYRVKQVIYVSVRVPVTQYVRTGY
ncbi:MAG: hypothetical protein O3B86_04030 [Planctomycetota bacterium]|nr:hypothetical protein [Planctomycetota bacterium]